MELHRLAQTIKDIDHDSSVVPKGSYNLNESQEVVPALDFRGLSNIEALKLNNYVHLRAPQSLDKLRAMVRDDIEWRTTGFLIHWQKIYLKVLGQYVMKMLAQTFTYVHLYGQATLRSMFLEQAILEVCTSELASEISTFLFYFKIKKKNYENS